MKLAITGASGFIGKYLIAEALNKGFEVIAITRQSKEDYLAKFIIEFQPKSLDSLAVKECDLNDTQTLSLAISGSDTVIHLAASMSGNNQYQETLNTTNSIIEAIHLSCIKSLVLLSSISVLDYIHQKPLTIIDEKAPLCSDDNALGDYARMKRDQEVKAQQWHLNTGHQLIIIRPGLVYNDNQLSTAHAGYIKNSFGITALHSGEVPLIKVNELAKQVIALFKQPLFKRDIFHLIGKPSVSQKEYLNQLSESNQLRAYLPIPWKLYEKLASLIRWAAEKSNKQHLIPDSFRANSVAARQKPFTFNTEKYDRFIKG